MHVCDIDRAINHLYPKKADIELMERGVFEPFPKDVASSASGFGFESMKVSPKSPSRFGTFPTLSAKQNGRQARNIQSMQIFIHFNLHTSKVLSLYNKTKIFWKNAFPIFRGFKGV